MAIEQNCVVHSIKSRTEVEKYEQSDKLLVHVK